MPTTFLTANLPAVRGIITQLNRPFDSHCFIRAYSSAYQCEYIESLHRISLTSPQNPFQVVHAAIGRFLLGNQAALGITANGKVDSANVFGKITSNEEWV
jgi:hypothetical protein